MTGTTRTPAYRRLTVEQRRAQLLSAAVGLFAHRAPEDVSLDDVAAAAGASRPLVYRYFPGGKQQIYEAVLRTAADELTARLGGRRTGAPEHGAVSPAAGSPLERLARALGRYLAFVDENDTGYAALMRGGSLVTAGDRATAVVEGVRRAALEEVLGHLGALGDASPRLRLAVRSWIAAVEVAALAWLEDGRRPGAAELERWLVDHFCGTLAAAARADPRSARAAAELLAAEPPGDRAADLLRSGSVPPPV